MKRNTKPFSVEIKKPRVQGQRHQLPPRRLFDATPLEVNKVFEREKPQADPEPVPAPRILPSIVEPLWSSSEPVEAIRRKRASGKTSRKQMELDLTTSISEGVTETHSAVPVITEAVPQADSAAEENPKSVHDVQPVQGGRVKTSSRKPRKKASEVAEQTAAFQPVIDREQITETEMIAPSVVMASRAAERKLTKRQAAATQLQRHERWKRRLHPAAW